LKIPFL